MKNLTKYLKAADEWLGVAIKALDDIDLKSENGQKERRTPPRPAQTRRPEPTTGHIFNIFKPPPEEALLVEIRELQKQQQEADLRHERRILDLTAERDRLGRIAKERGQELAEADRIRPTIRIAPDGSKWALRSVYHEALGGPLMVSLTALESGIEASIELDTWQEWKVK